MNQQDRITQMEERLDRAAEAVDRLCGALETFESVQDDLRELERYYTDGRWQKDYEADEAGKLPPALKRGVLSQDAVFDLLAARDGALETMKKWTEET